MTEGTQAAVSNAREAGAHAAEVAGLDGAAALLSAAGLTQLLGTETEPTHLRMKPGHSVIVSHRGLHSGEHGWTMLTADADKYGKLLSRAEKLRRELTVHRTESPYLVSGSVWADRWLGRELEAARAALGADARWQILRYNPRRRVVAVVDHFSEAGEPARHVVRVGAEPLDHIVTAAERWREAGLPISRVKPLGGRGTAVTAPLWGHTDLLKDPYAPAAHSAGRRIAELHTQVSRSTSAEGLAMLEADVDDHVDAVAQVAPWLAERVETLAEKLTSAAMAQDPGEPVQLHGDLSPDQILLAAPGSHKIRIIDLDRAGLGPAMRDVGSWAASCRGAGVPELQEAFLAGYQEVSPTDPAAMALWESYAHLASALDPFRNCDAAWADKVTRRIESAETAVENCALPTP